MKLSVFGLATEVLRTCLLVYNNFCCLIYMGNMEIVMDLHVVVSLSPPIMEFMFTEKDDNCGSKLQAKRILPQSLIFLKLWTSDHSRV